jgi:iron complex outermembrane receptor protein
MPGNGNLVFRALATYTAKFATTDAVSTIDRAGQLGGFGVDAVPHWQGNATLTYSLPRFSTSLQGRFIQGGNINNLAKPGTSSSANIYTVPAVTYWNLSASYDIVPPSNRRQIQIFANVNNLFDKNPPFPFLASSFVPGPYYDPIGRAFRFGVRVKG